MTQLPFIPGDRVLVFDASLYKDDVLTPSNQTFKPATVTCHYGCLCPRYDRYSSLIDVLFDHKPKRISKGHFAEHVSYLEE